MRFLLLLPSFVLALALTGVGGATPSAEAPTRADASPKRCKTVVKKVRGKKRKVRVCPKKKPAPKPKTPGPARPNPYSVSVQLDAERAVTAVVGPGGGTVTATTSGGVTFGLALPAGALLSDTTVTLTPVRAVERLPFAGLVGAVDVAPDGLRLLAPGTLTIASSALPAASARAGFGYSGSGAEFHLEPVRTVGDGVALTVRHFSGYGLASASASDRSGFAATHPPSSPLDGAAQAAAAGAAAAQLAALLDAGAARITAAAASAATLDLAVTEFVSWSALLDSLAGTLGTHHGRLTASREQLRALLRSALARAVADARTRCFSQHDMGAVVATLRFARYAPLVPAPDVAGQAASAVTACLRFELDVDVMLREDTDVEPATAVVQVRGLSLRDAGAATGLLTGQAPLSVVSYGVADYQCWSHSASATAAQPFLVRALRFDLNVYAGSPAAPPFELAVSLGSLTESVTHTCGGDPQTTYTDTRDMYSLCSQLLLPDGRVPSWEVVGGAVWARSTVAASNGCGGSATFTLRHTPAP